MLATQGRVGAGLGALVLGWPTDGTPACLLACLLVYPCTTQGRIVEDWVDSEDVQEHDRARIGTVVPKAVEVSLASADGVGFLTTD